MATACRRAARLISSRWSASRPPTGRTCCCSRSCRSGRSPSSRPGRGCRPSRRLRTGRRSGRRIGGRITRLNPRAAALGRLRPGKRDPARSFARDLRLPRARPEPARLPDASACRPGGTARLGEGAADLASRSRETSGRPADARRQPSRDVLPREPGARHARAPACEGFLPRAHAARGNRGARRRLQPADGRARLLRERRVLGARPGDRSCARARSRCNASRELARSSAGGSAASSSPTTHHSRCGSREPRRSTGGVPGAGAFRLPERGLVRAAGAHDGRRDGGATRAGSRGRP